MPLAKWRLVMPSSDSMTSSPGSTSRSYLACNRSSAQVSEAKQKVSGAPSSPAMRPMQRGRKPCGSRAAKMRLRVISTMEKGAVYLLERIGHAVDERVAGGVCDQLHDDFGVGGSSWKIAPSRSSRALAVPRLMRLPLCAMAMRPLVDSTEMGWALSRAESPVVE